MRPLEVTTRPRRTVEPVARHDGQPAQEFWIVERNVWPSFS
ncbi:uncharacterized protein METZ01_LOCUS105186 [marine metagenome]|uniref:Uncharacterized protein n=1 Tax=marine metagenome TaxID=408172 RepID=A0A381WIQ4_9ZZZZ